jgi:hypothetical protein
VYNICITCHGISIPRVRRQLPLRCLGATTVDSAQGSTVTYVACDCVDGFFSHGHFYVSVTRTRRAADLTFIISEKQDKIQNPLNKWIVKLLFQGRRKEVESILRQAALPAAARPPPKTSGIQARASQSMPKALATKRTGSKAKTKAKAKGPARVVLPNLEPW